MPELPEVENLVVGVRSAALGGRFTGVEFFRDDIREPIDKKTITNILLNQQVTAVKRRGKYMLIETKKGALGIHLGMTGRFIVDSAKEASRTHTHVVFSFEREDGSPAYFHFIDPRRFGRVFAATPHQAKHFSHVFLQDLGKEPLSEDTDLARHLFDESRGRSAPIKNFIMDSRIVVGVGNIYASESLWYAKISPLRQAKCLSEGEMKRLAKEIIRTLRRAIRAGGTTFRDYRNSEDKPGGFQVNLAVYERAAKPCAVCTTFIEKIAQAGRFTYFCPFCQK